MRKPNEALFYIGVASLLIASVTAEVTEGSIFTYAVIILLMSISFACGITYLRQELRHKTDKH